MEGFGELQSVRSVSMDTHRLGTDGDLSAVGCRDGFLFDHPQNLANRDLCLSD